jgi:hypothetical protein
MRAVRTRAFTIAVAIAAGLAPQGCSCGNDADLTDAGVVPTYDQCDADPPEFVRHAFLAIVGHRPRSQEEVDVYVDIFEQVKAIGDEAGSGSGAPPPVDPREVVARAILDRPELAERWIDVIMDALHVQRTDIQSEVDCWSAPLRSTVSPALATAVRDQMATQGGDGAGSWTMLDLARSAIALDDLTPVYRAQLFSMVAHPIPAANVPDVEAELARREDFGSTFDASYLHRDVVCLGCHTSETSITDSDEAELDRHWPAPGAPERAVYGNPMGVTSERAHAAFRVDGFVERNGTQRPWGWSNSCGRFSNPTTIGNDIANVDGKLGSVTGTRSTVYNLEQALARGFGALRGTGVAADETIADPDKALAWLVTLKMTEDIWRAATGTNLTIANYFPRNAAARDLLYSLANRYAQSGYSLKALLVAIVTSDYFARLAPDAGCGESPYTYPNVFDPWVIADSDEARRLNGPGDAVTAIDARMLMGALSYALEWPTQPGGNRFPDFGEGCTGTGSMTCQQLGANCNQNQICCASYEVACEMGGVFPAVEVPFQQSVGTFLRNSERGFRGLDFQARLAWEDRYGACARPGWVGNDFIDGLVGRGNANPTTTVGDVIRALKDRLTNEPTIDPGAETEALAAIVGPLDASAAAATADGVRRVCGALVVSPQFLLQGIAGRGGERPILTPGDASYASVCADVATRGIAGHTIACGTPDDPTLTVTPTP